MVNWWWIIRVMILGLKTNSRIDMTGKKKKSRHTFVALLIRRNDFVTCSKIDTFVVCIQLIPMHHAPNIYNMHSPVHSWSDSFIPTIPYPSFNDEFYKSMVERLDELSHALPVLRSSTHCLTNQVILVTQRRIQFLNEGIQARKTGKWELTTANTLHLMLYDHANLKRAGAFSLLEFSDCMMSTLQTVDLFSKTLHRLFWFGGSSSPRIWTGIAKRCLPACFRANSAEKPTWRHLIGSLLKMSPIAFFTSPIPNKIRLPCWHIDYRPFQTHFFFHKIVILFLIKATKVNPATDCNWLQKYYSLLIF
jgi:hypothetical protein